VGQVSNLPEKKPKPRPSVAVFGEQFPSGTPPCVFAFAAARRHNSNTGQAITVTSQVVFNFPTDLLNEAQSAATESRRGLEEVVVRSVETGLHSLKLSSELEDFAAMSDAEVLALADSQMPSEQSERMSQLLDRQREGAIDRLERAELASLMQFYQTGQLLKAGGLVEAVRRGLRPSLSP
jgi:hypothetical protein